MQLSLADFIRDNGLGQFGSGAYDPENVSASNNAGGVDLSLGGFRAATGLNVANTDQRYKDWAVANLPQSYRDFLNKNGKKEQATWLEGDSLYVPDKNLASNLAQGWDFKDALPGLMLMAAPAAGLAGAFGAAGSIGGMTAGAGAGAGAAGGLNLSGYGAAFADGGLAGGVGGAGAGGLGGGDWWSQYGLTPGDVGMEAGGWSTNPGMGDLTGGVLNDAGSTSAWASELGKVPTSALQQAKDALSKGSSAKSIADALGISEGAIGMLGKLGATALGMYGSNQQANSLEALANKYQEYGAPSRARYEASMTPGFDPMSIPGYSGAVDTASKGLLARLSATSGNPYGSPGGLIEANKSIISGTAMPAIGEYQRLNANTGFGSSMNAAVNLDTSAIGADRGITTALASGLGDLTAPDNSLAALFKKFNSGGFQLNNGLA